MSAASWIQQNNNPLLLCFNSLTDLPLQDCTARLASKCSGLNFLILRNLFGASIVKGTLPCSSCRGRTDEISSLGLINVSGVAPRGAFNERHLTCIETQMSDCVKAQ